LDHHNTLPLPKAYSRDQIIVITGGGTGLGRMMAEGLVINGAKVYIIGRRAEMLEKAVREINAESVGEGQVFSWVFPALIDFLLSVG
jgi:NADP-dependent 3-hydroxy acid dehydrogenase YdfG